MEAILDAAKIAVFLLSPSYLSCQAIYEHELSRILRLNSTDGMAIVPVLIRPVAVELIPWLEAKQRLPRDGRAIATRRSKARQDELLAEVAREIARMLDNPPAFTRALPTSSAALERVESLGSTSTPNSEPSDTTITVRGSTELAVRWAVVLQGTLDEINESRLRLILSELRALSQDATLTLSTIVAGSVKLILHGSSAGYELVAGKFENRMFSTLGGIPVARIEALGYKTASSAGGSPERGMLARKVTETLRGAPLVVDALLAHGFGERVADSVPSVVRALLSIPASMLVGHLAQLSSESPSLRESIRSLFFLILPLAADWSDILGQVSTEKESRTIELPVHSETLAEVILARLDGRSTEFVAEEGFPRGALCIPFPAAAHALFSDADALAVAIVQELFPLDVRPSAKRISFTRLVDRVRDQSQNPHGYPYYLTISEDVLERVMGVGGANNAWETLKAALTARLPGLRLVRLRGSAQWQEAEMELVLRISALLERGA